MLDVLKVLVLVLSRSARSRADLLAENAALRQQLAVLRRQVKRPQIRRADRAFWVWLCRHWPGWRSALVIVKPETVLRWHRRGYKLFWRWRSGGRPGRPRIPRQHIDFIRRISLDHPEWGEDRIALLLEENFGVHHDPSTVPRYMVDGGRPGRSTWGRFIASHAGQMWSLDFTTQVMWDFTVCYVLVVLALDSRRVVCVAVTRSPTVAWLKQQLRQATEWGEGCRFLIHDNDAIFGQRRRPDPATVPRKGKWYRCTLDQWLAEVLSVTGVPIPYGAPNASAHVERFMRTLREECLRHFIFFSEAHLRRVVLQFARYYNEDRVHQGIAGVPDVVAGLRPAHQPPPDGQGRLVARPVLGGIAHDYRLAA